MHSSLLISNNHFLHVALHSLTGIKCIEPENFINKKDTIINSHLSMVLLDFTCIVEFSAAAAILFMIRSDSPETKICVIRSSATSLRYLTANPNILATDPVDLFLIKLKAAILQPTSLRYPPRRLTQQECRFLSLYLKNHNMHQIARRLKIAVKTAYTVKNNIWKKADIHRDIDIVLFRGALEKYLARVYPTSQM